MKTNANKKIAILDFYSNCSFEEKRFLIQKMQKSKQLFDFQDKVWNAAKCQVKATMNIYYFVLD